MSNPDKDLIRSLYKALEVLFTRIGILEDIIVEMAGDGHLVQVFGGRICSWDSLGNLIMQKRSTAETPEFRCPAVKCSRKYERLDRLQRHIRKSKCLRHRSPREIIDRNYCLQCHKRFKNGKGLASHDVTHHREQGSSRINSFAPFLGSKLCK